MTTYGYNLIAALLLSGALVSSFIPSAALSQSPMVTVYESPLILGAGPAQRGSVQATLDGSELELFVTFSSLTTPWIQIDLYRGHPSDGGVGIRNLAVQIPTEHLLGGGLDAVVPLTDEQLADLNDGLFYLVVHSVSGDAADRLSAKIELVPSEATQYLETPLSRLWNSYPISPGGVRAIVTDDGLRLIGFVNGLSSSWQMIGLYRGTYGQVGEVIAAIWSVGTTPKLNDAFDQTFSMEENWEDDLHAGRLFVVVQTSRPEDALSGRLYPSSNRAPAASQLTSPVDGDYVVIGGVNGGAPVDQNTYLGQVSFSHVDDPDQHPVAYLWQASLRADFASPSVTYDLGVDSTRFPLTVGRAAEIADVLTTQSYGAPRHHTPVTVYHRVITTDGSLFSIGAMQSVTLVRGQITSTDPDGELPARLTLRGNYPNPFNPSTSIVFDLPAAAMVSVDVYDVMGRRVLALRERGLSPGLNQRINVEGSALASGSYLYRLQARTASGMTVESGRMTLVK